MKIFNGLRNKLQGLSDSILRYPVTVAFLIAAATMIAIQIGDSKELVNNILACAVGAIACATAQAAYERFFTGLLPRIILFVAGCVIAILHYLIIRQISALSIEIPIRSIVAIFALFITFIWIAVTRSKYTFNESFMAAFKSLFQSLFYSAVIFGGCSAIIAAIDLLITPINSDAYAHTANIVFVLFAPIFFLSLIPIYPGKNDTNIDPTTIEARREVIEKRSFCPKFFEILLSYIVIPLASVYTVILLIYIILNIGGKFWTDNLLEPMLVSYTIVVIVVTILISRLENKFAVLFRRIFPKVLIPIALFQTASSLLIMADTGITFSRYFVILYGIFAICSGVVLSVVPVRKNGIIAIILIILSFISITPPTDAFTVSRTSQINTLERILMENDMLSDNSVTPNGTISEEDKTAITSTLNDLSRMEALDKISWLPENFNIYDDSEFYTTFGFHQYEIPDQTSSYIYVTLNAATPIPIDGSDYFTTMYIAWPDQSAYPNNLEIEQNGETYQLAAEKNAEGYDIVLLDSNGVDLVRFHSNDILSKYEAFPSDKPEISLDEATFSVENDSAKLTIVVQNASIDKSSDRQSFNFQIYIFVNFK